MTNNEKVLQFLADSRLAFLNQQNGMALKLANCAANACMSLERYDEAIKNYISAVRYDSINDKRNRRYYTEPSAW